ncbi:MAG: ATP-NAD kinase family protein [Candidatus Bathyarchaeota archaeon]|nr:MAG: ATP-NAD kinase family protein [Candidatus Bathyarchaeota archaeon]
MSKTTRRLGFLINPIAGMGGRVGLKGTDGVFNQATQMGAKPIAPKRGIEFLKKLVELKIEHIRLITCPGIMGEEEIRSVGLDADTLPMRIKAKTTSKDTKRAIKLMIECNVDLILFVGGDGTARDILDELPDSNTPLVLGIPSGVKMYSGIFAINPAEAAYVVEAFLRGQTHLADFEVMDADETDIRHDRFNLRLYGIIKGPFLPMYMHGSKHVSPLTMDEHDNQVAIARSVIEQNDPDSTYILGPGSTVKCVAELLGVKKTFLGVDLYHEGTLIEDVNEERILKSIVNWQKVWIVVSPIGRQGILFGRGNQQISPSIIKLVGRERIIVVATKSKLQSIEGGVLRVDTGNADVDKMLKGFIRVATDYREWRVLPIK